MEEVELNEKIFLCKNCIHAQIMEGIKINISVFCGAGKNGIPMYVQGTSPVNKDGTIKEGWIPNVLKCNKFKEISNQ